MPTLNQSIQEYSKQLAQGDIKQAYQGLMQYMMELRNRFQENHPNYFVSGSIYQGQMDYTFFQFTPKELRERKLKTIILLDHEKMSFAIWLCGVNKKVQKEYWDHFKANGWDKHYMPTDLKGVDSIVECMLIEKPDFDNLAGLSEEIAKGSLAFIGEVNAFLEKN